MTKLGKDDLDLIDALVAGGCINRAIAREVVDKAQPGMVASYINERGYAIACHGWPTIIDRLARAEAEYESMQAACKAAGDTLIRHGIPISTVRASSWSETMAARRRDREEQDPTPGGRLRDQYEEKPETD